MTDYYGIDYIIKQKESDLKELEQKSKDLENKINYAKIEIRSLKRMQKNKKII